MNPPAIDERRQHYRVPIAKPCKVFHPATRRYLPGRTTDVSAGGALLRVNAPRPLVPGDEIEMYIAWNNRSLLTTSEQMRGRVTRTLFDGNEQIIAIEFAQAQVVETSAAA